MTTPFNQISVLSQHRATTATCDCLIAVEGQYGKVSNQLANFNTLAARAYSCRCVSHKLQAKTISDSAESFHFRHKTICVNH